MKLPGGRWVRAAAACSGQCAGLVHVAQRLPYGLVRPYGGPLGPELPEAVVSQAGPGRALRDLVQ
jgi:hypothetical protein